MDYASDTSVPGDASVVKQKLVQPTEPIYTAQVETIADLFYDTVWRERCVSSQTVLPRTEAIR